MYYIKGYVCLFISLLYYYGIYNVLKWGKKTIATCSMKNRMDNIGTAENLFFYFCSFDVSFDVVNTYS